MLKGGMPPPLRQHLHDALVSLGRAFLVQPENRALRANLASGRMSAQDYYTQLLRLVYRLVLVLILEQRALLHPDEAPTELRRLYADDHSLGGLPRRTTQSLPPGSGLWPSCLRVLRGLGNGLPELGLPRLSGIFADDHCRDLYAASLEDGAFLQALSCLGSSANGSKALPWQHIGTEELGGAYESLMARSPRVFLPPDEVGFTLDEDTKGNARKKSGSYYTPDRLVQHLVDLALDPPIAETLATRPADPVEALLSLRIVDPACGSGHFLLGAARRLAMAVARERAGGEPPPSVAQEAFFEVIRRCIYGVDLNPMAVELCKVALWLEARRPGMPMDLLDNHIQLGNALLGASAAQITAGIPENAWEPVEGEDRTVAKRLRSRHRTEMEPVRATPLLPTTSEDLRLLADLWCSAFVWPKEAGETETSAPLPALWSTICASPSSIPSPTRRIVAELHDRYHFFHWFLAFPEVFARGGFDVVLGNPPYLNQLESNTVVGRGVSRLLDARFGPLKQAYTDLATLFMVEAQRILRPGGRQVLVHPLAMFAAKDAGPVRRYLAGHGAISGLWITTEHIFEAALVFVGAVCIVKGASRRSLILRHHGNDFTPAEPLPLDMDQLAAEPTWGALIADLIGVPRVELPNPVRLGSMATTTADFRDEFYGLAPFVVEDTPETRKDRYFPPLIVTGLIDPAENLWGQRSCRFAKNKWERPRVDLAALKAQGDLAAWAKGRLVPKIVVATQTRAIEALADPEGILINSVPTITVIPMDPDTIWRLLAVLLAPPVSAWALGRYAGSALSIAAIKMSADQVAQIPLPMLEEPWEEAAKLVRQASASSSLRLSLLGAAATKMCDAYEVPREPVWSWWRERLGD